MLTAELLETRALLTPGADLAFYEFANHTTATPELFSTDTHAETTASDISSQLSLGWTGNGEPPNGLALGGAFNETTEPTPAGGQPDFFEFTITPDAGYAMDVATFGLLVRRNDPTSKNSFAVYFDEDPGSNGDNYTTKLLAGVLTTEDQFESFSINTESMPAFAGITSPLNFRVYAWGTAGTDTIRLDNIRVQGLQETVSQSEYAYYGDADRLISPLDEQGNRVPDFSSTGYMYGNEPIPDVAGTIDVSRIVTVSPVAGDDMANIQAAIDQVGQMTPDSDGFRGVVQLTAGEFEISNQVQILQSGIVLRGVDDGADPTSSTILRGTGTIQRSLVVVGLATGFVSPVSGTTHNITDKYVPVGATSFEVDSTDSWAVGDEVVVNRPSTAEWITAIGMDSIPERSDGGTVIQWQAGGNFDQAYERVITRIEGNRVFVNAPLTNAIEQQYGGATVFKYTFPRISHVGVENIRGLSDFVSDTDEDHARSFVELQAVEHAWVTNVTGLHFVYATVHATARSRMVTVDDAVSLDPKSIITGGRRYPFVIDGQFTLMKNLYSEDGRHDFVNNSSWRNRGPNVFLNGTAVNSHSATGPHQRWSTGTLYDTIVTDNQIEARNRGNFGTGHGWGGANMVFWNTTADSYIVQNPQTAQNWLIGSTGTLLNETRFGQQPPPNVDAQNTPVDFDKADNSTNSLFVAQLNQRTEFDFEKREYVLGDYDLAEFDGAGSADEVYVDATWQTDVETLANGQAVNAFDTSAGTQFVPASFQFSLQPGEGIVAAVLTVGLRGNGSDTTGDNLWLDDLTTSKSLASLDQVDSLSSTTTTPLTIEITASDLQLLQDGLLNLAVSSNTVLDWATLDMAVGPALTLVFASSSISEADGSGATTATVTRSSDTSDELVVTLLSSDAGEATVPATVTIAAGETTSAPFDIDAVKDAFVDGTQAVTITAAATDYVSAAQTVDVTDEDTPELTVSISESSIRENGGTVTATVSRNTNTTDALTVTLLSSDTGEATVPTTVSIPAGQATSATFDISAVDDQILDSTQTVTISASANTFTDGFATLDVVDSLAHRTSQFTVRVQDQFGNPLPNATIDISMTQHAFQFGTQVQDRFITITESEFNALAVWQKHNLIGDRNQELPTPVWQDAVNYRTAVYDNFNHIIPTNGMQWVQYRNTGPIYLDTTIQAAQLRNITVTGHAVVWQNDGWPTPTEFRPDANPNPQEFHDALISDRLSINGVMTRFSDSGDGPNILDWDVLNEPLHETHYSDTFVGAGIYANANEVFADYFIRADALRPEANLAVNDYNILSSGGDAAASEYRDLINDLLALGAPIDQIKVQAHMARVVSKADIIRRFDILAETGLPIAISEFDMRDDANQISVADQKQLFQDILEASFEHESVTGFSMWGIWDSAHWRGNGPLYDGDWNIKDEASPWFDLVQGEWKTNLTDVAVDSQGEWTADAGVFNGTYQLVGTNNGIATTIDDYELTSDGTAVITINVTPPGFTVDKTVAAVTESTGSTHSDSFTVVLNAQPMTDVVLAIGNADSSEVATDESSLTFTAANWSTPQRVTLTGVDDFVVDGDVTTAITVSVDAANSDDSYDNVASQSVTTTTTDDDEAGFTVNKTTATVSETGTTDDFTVVLNTQPLVDVVFTIDNADTNEVLSDQSSLTFTTSNWNTPQTVTLTGVDDFVVDGDMTTTITVSVDAANSDDTYDSVAAQSVNSTTTDDDEAGFTVSKTTATVTETGTTDNFTVVLNAQPLANVVFTIENSDVSEVLSDRSELTFTATNWNTPQTVTLSSVDDFVIDGDVITSLTLTIDPATSDDAFDSLASQSVAVTTSDDDEAGFTVNKLTASISEAGTTDSFTVVLTAEPATDVVLAIDNGDASEVSLDQSLLTFTSLNWNTPQTVEATGADDFLIDGDVVTSIMISVDATNSDAAFASVGNQSVAVTTTDDDFAGFIIDKASATVSEAGGSDTVRVILTAQPLVDVVITIDNADSSEFDSDQTQLTFTSENWSSPQTVTLTGVDDFLVDGDVTTSMTVSVNAANSDDAFDAIGSQSVEVTTSDDDEAGFTINKTLATVSETGTSDNFTVVLNAEPVEDVVLLINNADSGEVVANAVQLTFTALDWQSPQTISLSGVNDFVDDGDESTLITVSIDAANSDNGFENVNPQTVETTTTDDDVAGFAIGIGSASVSETGTSAEFTVVLSAQPIVDVVLLVDNGDTSEVVIAPAALTFTPANWNIAQTIELTGVDDFLVDGDSATSITFSVDAGSSDDAFGGIGSQSVDVTTVDDDAAGFTIDKTSTTVSESGTTDGFSVVLNAKPNVAVVLDINSGDPGEVTVDQSVLTFTAGNWNTPQTVTVMGVDDSDLDGDVMTSITISVDPLQSDDAFDSLLAQIVAVTNSDDEPVFSIDVDGDASTRALTDGVLLIRYLAGFTGDPLVAGAVNMADGTRIESADVIAWLAPYRSTHLDIDGNGTAQSLTDGILMIRYLAGFRGDALINSAVDATGTRTTAPEVTAFLDGLVSASAGPTANGSSANGPLPTSISHFADTGEFVPPNQFRNPNDTNQTLKHIASAGVIASANEDWRNTLSTNRFERFRGRTSTQDELDDVFSTDSLWSVLDDRNRLKL